MPCILIIGSKLSSATPAPFHYFVGFLANYAGNSSESTDYTMSFTNASAYWPSNERGSLHTFIGVSTSFLLRGIS